MTNILTWFLLASFVVLSKTQEDDDCPGGHLCTYKKYPDYKLCVQEGHMCDGYEDCDDGSDVSPEEVCRTKCPDMWCQVEKMCMREYMICDGVQHCSDGSDEPDTCESRCPDLWCASEKKCFDEHWMCNGWKQCTDGSDEPDNCESMCPDSWCAADKMCLSQSMICNGYKQCSDGSDEHDNCEQICEDRGDHWCAESDAEITSGRHRSKACIKSAYVCDNEKDCRDGSDENEC